MANKKTKNDNKEKESPTLDEMRLKVIIREYPNLDETSKDIIYLIATFDKKIYH